MPDFLIPDSPEARQREKIRADVFESADVAAVGRLSDELTPHQIFLPGDRDDPSSIGAVTCEVVLPACGAKAAEAWLPDCRICFYRSVEMSWDAAEVDMAVRLSPREPWPQVEQHNRALAELYDKLGLANYEAIEAFQRHEL